MQRAIWILVVLLGAIGWVGVMRAGPYVPEFAGLLLLALAIALRRATWGAARRDSSENEDRP